MIRARLVTTPAPQQQQNEEEQVTKIEIGGMPVELQEIKGSNADPTTLPLCGCCGQKWSFYSGTLSSPSCGCAFNPHVCKKCGHCSKHCKCNQLVEAHHG